MTESETAEFLIPSPVMPSEENTFAHYTLVNRLPAVIERVIKENDFPPDIVEELEIIIEELFEGLVRPIADDEGPDVPAWASYLIPFEGKSWFDVPFFLLKLISSDVC